MDSLCRVHSGGYAVLLVITMTWLQASVFLVIHQGLLGVYLGCSFAPNHKGMPVLTAEQAADPLLRQVLTSCNVRGGPFVDFVLGGSTTRSSTTCSRACRGPICG